MSPERSGTVGAAVTLAMIVAAIAGFFAGIEISTALLKRWSPPRNGEMVIANQLSALFLGGPTGALVSSCLAGITAHRLQLRVRPAVAALLLSLFIAAGYGIAAWLQWL